MFYALSFLITQNKYKLTLFPFNFSSSLSFKNLNPSPETQTVPKKEVLTVPVCYAMQCYKEVLSVKLCHAIEAY